MSKPISIAINEFKNDIVNIINSSGIPVCIVQMALSDIVNQVNDLANQELQRDLKEYAESEDANNGNNQN